MKGVLAALAVMAALLLALGARSAAAHDTSTALSGDGSRAYLLNNHQDGWVCDNDPDGHYAFIRFKDYNGGYWTGYDQDGYGGSCWAYSNSPAYIAYDICVQYEGCGQPYYLSFYWGTPIW